MIPKQFNEDGLLDVGTYEATLDDLRKSILIEGDGSSATWDRSWRLHLTHKLEILVRELWSVGVKEVFIDGSFVENKDHPNDIDGYFDPHLKMDEVSDIVKFEVLISKLNLLNPNKVWTWAPESRRPYKGYGKAQLPMWHFYRVELYPHLGQATGIKDQHGNEQTFPAAFRVSRNDFMPKGIIKIVASEGI